jgi:GNAT superfamily N-acetyltransferase
MSQESGPTPMAAAVRPAGAADNSGLLALVRRCPMNADISLIVERDPDFFALGRARGDAHTLVAEVEGTIVGCISSWYHSAWVGGRQAEISYVGDLRVDPEVRRRGVGWQLAKANFDHLKTLPAMPYLAATGAGNAAVAPLVAAFGAGGPPIARFTSWQLLPVVPLKIPSALDIAAAESGDADELVALLDDFHRRRDFAPVFSDGGFAALLARSTGMQFSDYLVARRRGRIAAAIGVWDASQVKRTRVVGMPPWLRGLCAVGRGASRVAAVPPFPKRGALLHFRYIRHAAHGRGEEGALQALVRWAVNAARAREEHFVLYTCADDDPLCSAVAGAPRLRFRYGIVSSNFRPEARATSAISGAPSWYFDDAALA